MRAQGAPDLLALIPYQLGFAPQESLVATFVDGRRIRLTARLDLPPVSAAAEVADWLRSLARQNRADQVVLFAYSADAGPARALVSAVIAALPRRLVREALYVDGTRWWSLTCGPDCCPAEGTPYAVADHRLAAEAVYAGMTALDSRQQLEATLSGPPAAELERLTGVVEQVRGAQQPGCAVETAAARVVELVEAGCREPGGVDDRACAELGLLVTDLRLRDLAWALMDPATAKDHLRLWLRVVDRSVPSLSAGPLALAGMAGWIGGDGALLNCAAAELARRHPAYSMGRLLAELSAHAVPPSLWRSLGAEMHEGVVAELDRLAG